MSKPFADQDAFKVEAVVDAQMTGALWDAYCRGYNAPASGTRSPYSGHEPLPLHAAWCHGHTVAAKGDSSHLICQIHSRLVEIGHQPLQWGAA